MISRLVSLLQHAQSIHAAHLTTLQSRVSAVQTALGAVDVPKDQDLFIDHNIRPFTAPGDWGFEPCAGYYDTVGPLSFLRGCSENLRLFWYREK